MTTNIPDPLHFSCYWNLDVDWNPRAPEGMRLWAEILNKFHDDHPDQRYTWYGKLSFTLLGIPADEATMRSLNEQIQAQSSAGRETRLYLYTYYEHDGMKVPYSLHAGRVVEVADQRIYDDPEERKHLPAQFYNSMFEAHEVLRERRSSGEAIPFFFKLTDLREINISDADNLRKTSQAPEESRFTDFCWDIRKSPAFVQEKRQTLDLFDETNHWWAEVCRSSHDLDPGKFRSYERKEVYYQALRYSALNVPLLITGERGTGKTSLAGIIRRNSSYCKKRYPDKWHNIPCGDFASPQNLEDFLFKKDKGVFDEASGETVLLNDVENMPRFLQRKCLRQFLAQKSLPNEESFRLVAATTLPREELADQLDAYFLHGMTSILEIPPIRRLTPEDKRLVWDFHYHRVVKSFAQVSVVNSAPNFPVEEQNAFFDALSTYHLLGNFLDLERIGVRLLLELKFRDTAPVSNKKAFLEPDRVRRIIEEALPYLDSKVETAEEKAKTLALWFFKDRPLEDAFDIDSFEELKELADNLLRRSKFYIRRNLKRLEENGHETAKEIVKKHSGWMSEHNDNKRTNSKRKENDSESK